jgi:tight adherence protein B
MLKILFFLLILAVFLIFVAAALTMSIIKLKKQEELFDKRVSYAIDPFSKLIDSALQISLTKKEQDGKAWQDKLASFVNLQLYIPETYPIKWWLIPFIALFVSFVIIWLASHPIGHDFILYTFIWPIAWLFTTKFIFNYFNNRRSTKLVAQFPDAINTVVRCVRVGIPMGEALRTVGRDAPEPTKAEFTILADKVSIGIPLDVVLRELSERIPLTEYQFFATAITLQTKSGGGITQTLETLAEVIRKRVGLKARGYALTAEARTSAMLLAVLPVIAGIAIFFMQRPYIILLFNTKSGQSCLAAAIMLMAIGMGIIQTMINNVLK